MRRFGERVEPFVELIVRYVEVENDDLREQVMHACEFGEYFAELNLKLNV